jgi:hypothetical protein
VSEQLLLVGSIPYDTPQEVFEKFGGPLWIHIPMLDTTDEAFFAPLVQLEPGGARVYLGAIHNMERFGERVALARKYLPEFGLAAYCGFGRNPVSELPGILDDHLKAAQVSTST